MTKRSRVLVTGATGFVGQALCESLMRGGWHVRRAVRNNAPAADFAVRNIGPDTDWHAALKDVECIVHLAARTHVIDDDSRSAMDAYMRLNVEGTIKLARDAASCGVRRFVFLSSIKVNGEHTADRPYSEADVPHPQDAYGISKHEAEQALWLIARDTELDVTVLRPPLIYGPGAKANFLRLMHLCARRLPLPFASIANRRSLIYLGNLVDAIGACLKNSAANGKTYLVSDNESVATPELIREVSKALGVEPRLFRFPPSLMAFGATLLGRRADWQRLAGSLQVDGSRICKELGWRPPYSMAQGLAETAQWYHKQFPLKSNT